MKPKIEKQRHILGQGILDITKNRQQQIQKNVVDETDSLKNMVLIYISCRMGTKKIMIAPGYAKHSTNQVASDSRQAWLPK